MVNLAKPCSIPAGLRTRGAQQGSGIALIGYVVVVGRENNSRFFANGYFGLYFGKVGGIGVVDYFNQVKVLAVVVVFIEGGTVVTQYFFIYKFPYAVDVVDLLSCTVKGILLHYLWQEHRCVHVADKQYECEYFSKHDGTKIEIIEYAGSR